MSNNWKYWDRSGAAHEWAAGAELPSGADMFKVEFLNQFVDAINERWVVAGVVGNTMWATPFLWGDHVVPVARGDDVQLASLYNGWWAKILAACVAFITVTDIPADGAFFDPAWEQTWGSAPVQPDIDSLRPDDLIEFEVKVSIGDPLTPQMFFRFRKALERLRVAYGTAARSDASVSAYRQYWSDYSNTDHRWNDGVYPSEGPVMYPGAAWYYMQFAGGSPDGYQRNTSVMQWTETLAAAVSLPDDFAGRAWESQFALYTWWWWRDDPIRALTDWKSVGMNTTRNGIVYASLPSVSGVGSWSHTYPSESLGVLGDPSPTPPGIHATGSFPDGSLGGDVVQFVKMEMVYE